jgi:hypothetical protein
MSPFTLVWLENVMSQLRSQLTFLLKGIVSPFGVLGIFERLSSPIVRNMLSSTTLSSVKNAMWYSHFKWVFPQKLQYGGRLSDKLTVSKLPDMSPNHFYDCVTGQPMIDAIALINDATPMVQKKSYLSGSALLLFQQTINVNHDNNLSQYRNFVAALIKKFEPKYVQTLLVMPSGVEATMSSASKYSLQVANSHRMTTRSPQISCLPATQQDVPDVVLYQVDADTSSYSCSALGYRKIKHRR